MTTRLPILPAPGPLEPFAQRSQRQAFRDYLAALLLPTERTKTLTALAAHGADPEVLWDGDDVEYALEKADWERQETAAADGKQSRTP